MMGKEKVKRYYQNLYRFDPESSTYLVEVSLDDYDEVYDDWDPSPFKRRDIEDEFNDFIVDSSGDVPLAAGISIVLHLPEGKRSEDKETILVSAYRYFYGYIVQRLGKGLDAQRMRAMSYLVFSLIFMSIGYFFTVEGRSVVLTVLHEGILIGGWVFLWEFITTLFISGRETVREYKLYKRLQNAEVRFVYHEEAQPQ
jgi:hypothetical protein